MDENLAENKNIQPSPQPNKAKSSSIIRLILVLVFIAFVFMIFLLFQTRIKKVTQKEVIKQTFPTPVTLLLGSLSLQKSDQREVIIQNKTFGVDIIASSEDKLIVGYDVITLFNQDEFEILTATSLLDDFDTYPVKKRDHYIVTGVKKLEATERSIFEQTPILRLTLKPIKKGNLTLKIASNLDKERSQIVDEETTVLFPEVSELTIEVK